MDPVVATRLARALETDDKSYQNAVARHGGLTRIMADRLAGFDGWIAPTTAIVAPHAAAFEDPALGLELTLGVTCNTQPANLLDSVRSRSPCRAFLCRSASSSRRMAAATASSSVERILDRHTLANISLC